MGVMISPMSAKQTNMIVYLNGQFLDHTEARVSVFDRGFLFGDGVYESIRYFDTKPILLQAHESRFARSLRMIGVTRFDPAVLGPLTERLLNENDLTDAGVYWQVTRGNEGLRSHLPSGEAISPTLFGYAWELPSLEVVRNEIETVSAVLQPDLRWGRCDIKSINLLPNLLAQMEAEKCYSGEAILYRDEFITEGASSNVWMFDGNNWVTPPLECGAAGTAADHSILAGVTRQMVLQLPGVETIVRPIGVDEFRAADEIVLTSSTRLLRAVTCLEGKVVGDGGVGDKAKDLYQRILSAVRAEL